MSLTSRWLLAGLLVLLLAGCGDTLPVVAQADLQRLAGRWWYQGQPFNGAITATAVDGVRSLMPVRAGRVHGVVRSWYASGQLRSLRRYVQGAAVGVHRGWWPNGAQQYQRHFTDGVEQGLTRTWFVDGQLYEEHRYVAGHESGVQRLWFADGRLRANYVVRDGRRFGNIGSKPCSGAVAAS